MAPIHQRIAPARMLDVVLRALSQVSMHIARDLAHMRIVLVRQLVRALALDLDDAPPGLMADRLMLALISPADVLRVLRRKPSLDLGRAHIDRVLELLANVVVVFSAHGSLPWLRNGAVLRATSAGWREN